MDAQKFSFELEMYGRRQNVEGFSYLAAARQARVDGEAHAGKFKADASRREVVSAANAKAEKLEQEAQMCADRGAAAAQGLYLFRESEARDPAWMATNRDMTVAARKHGVMVDEVPVSTAS